jgi:4-diphosphocytidyl-2-C-methyl-D-erythritol kinase
MITFPNAKINLGLSVVEKRNDGYHNIETLFYPLPLRDALEMIGAKDGIQEFSSSGIGVPGNPDHNLVLKAWNLLQHDFKLPPVKIHLHKAIPLGAGLGGGSADAAFMIKLINQEFELNLPIAQMQEYAGKIGADCAFFIENKPTFAFGKGDQFLPVEINLSGYFGVIVKPAVNVNTADAYAGIVPRKPEISVKEIIKTPIENWNGKLKNDFEETVFMKFPEIGIIKDLLYKNGALYASMSGSGSAVYGIFGNEIDLKKTFGNQICWEGWLS